MVFLALAQQHHAFDCCRVLGKAAVADVVAVAVAVAAIVVGAGCRCQEPKIGLSAARHNIGYMLLQNQAHRPRVLAPAGHNQIPQARWWQVVALTVQQGLTLPCGKRKPLSPGKVAVVAAVVAAVAVAGLLLLMLV